MVDNEYFAGEFCLADMAPIRRFAEFKFDAIDLDECPHMVRRRDRLITRPAIRQAMALPIKPAQAAQLPGVRALLAARGGIKVAANRRWG